MVVILLAANKVTKYDAFYIFNMCKIFLYLSWFYILSINMKKLRLKFVICSKPRDVWDILGSFSNITGNWYIQPKKKI